MAAMVKSTGDSDTPPEPDDSTRVTLLPTTDMEQVTPGSTRTILHIYHSRHSAHKLITPQLSAPQERRWGPTLREQKALRHAKAAQKAQKAHTTPQPHSLDPAAFFLHKPRLAFHRPPCVLYTGSSHYDPAVPAALIHSSCFWAAFRIQIGPALAQPGVVDPRGVVSWAHNGGTRGFLRRDERGAGRLLRGYRVRGWRVWGETGRAYVRDVWERRAAKVVGGDPDGELKGGAGEKACADEVVWLRWVRPLSRHTRCYAFAFRGVEFQWRGTGSVCEERTCGWMLRFCHLKLVARVPVCAEEEKGERMREVCLGKYTSSLAAEKSGTLEVFDSSVLRFVRECTPSLLLMDHADDDTDRTGSEELEQGYLASECDEDEIAHLRKGVLYQLIVATVMCMAKAEKEKRHALIDLILGAGENAGNGGG